MDAFGLVLLSLALPMDSHAGLHPIPFCRQLPASCPPLSLLSRCGLHLCLGVSKPFLVLKRVEDALKSEHRIPSI